MAHVHAGHSPHHDLHELDPEDSDARKALLIALVLNAVYLFVEAGVGVWSGSLALLSDAAHMLGDVAALGLALGAAHLARTARAPDRTFGLRRAETLGAFTNGLALIGAALFICWEAAQRLLEGPPQVAGLAVLVVASIGLFVNLGSAWFLHRSHSDNLNVRGAMLHMAADALGSVGAMAAAVFVLLGYPIADALISIGIAVLIAFGAWSILAASGRILLQLPPANADGDALLTLLEAIDDVEQVHDMHVWTLDGRNAIVTAHLVVADESLMNPVRERAQHLLEHEGIPHATLQMEVDASVCGGCEHFAHREAASG